MSFFKNLFATYYSNNKHLWLLVYAGCLLGILIGIVGTCFQLAINLIYYIKNNIFMSTGNIYLNIIISILLTSIMVVSSILIVKKYAKEAGGSGIQEVEGTLKGCRKLRKRVVPVKFFSGILSLGSGLSLGKEGPTVHMSAALAHVFVDRFNLRKKYSNALISAGAGAGLATAFNTPLSGIVFVIEEMNKKFIFSFTAIKCVIVTCIVSIIVSRLIIGNPPAIKMTTYGDIGLQGLWLFAILGLIFGYLGMFFSKSIVKVANLFSNSKPIKYWTLVISVCIIFGIGVVLLPNSVGGGYVVIASALDNKLGIGALLFLFLFRLIGVLFSYGTGAAGGIFAPMIALGTIFGLAFGYIIQIMFPSYMLPPGVFAVAGMSALFTATVGAPLTGIVLVIEMTLNYHLLLPLMITCFTASMVTYLHHQRPIYDILLRRTISIEKSQKTSDSTKKGKYEKIKEDKVIIEECYK